MTLYSNMTLYSKLFGLTLLGCSAVIATSALAQSPTCSEGRTFGGKECINPGVAAVGRDRGINLVTRKLGGPSSGRNMPSTDTLYRDPAWQGYLRNSPHHGDVYIYTR